MMLTALMSGAACGGSEDESYASRPPQRPETPDDGPDTPPVAGSGRSLVIYCSRSGNTERLARQIQSLLDCEIREVEPQQPYADDYNAMLERAQEELAAIGQGNYPPIGSFAEDFESYENIFIGYPIWYGSMATPMQSFLHAHAAELTGKRLILFATSGSSGISSSVREARALCPAADLSAAALLLTSASLSQLESRVAAWLAELGIERGEVDDPGTATFGIHVSAGGRTFAATLENNAAGRDFLSRLPLRATLDDYAGSEKIFYPSPALDTEGVVRGCTPASGDITIYAPWGNVAIFYKDGGSYSDELIRIGHIDDRALEALSTAGTLQVRFEKPNDGE